MAEPPAKEAIVSTTRTTFYRRPLPDSCIEFASNEGKKLFAEGLQQGYMEGYFAIASYFQTQSEPAYCGLGTLSVVLNSLSIDPDRVWKGPWRWFSEELLDCCVPLEIVKTKGVTLEEFACLARCNGAKCTITRPTDSELQEFRKIVKRVSSSSTERLVVGYSRSVLGQTGTGHFSPIGGYHEESDRVLILDVARFKYPPHWVSLEVLYKAMQDIDSETGKPRGFCVLAANPKQVPILCRITVGKAEWRCMTHTYPAHVQQQLTNFQGPPTDILNTLTRMIMPISETQLQWICSLSSELTVSESTFPSPEHLNHITTIITQLTKTDVFKVVQEAGLSVNIWPKANPTKARYGLEILTLYLLAHGLDHILPHIPSQKLKGTLIRLFDISEFPQELRAEIEALRDVLDELRAAVCCSLGREPCNKPVSAEQALSPACHSCDAPSSPPI